MNKFFSFTAILFLCATIVLLWATQGEQAASPAGSAGVSGESEPVETPQEAAIGGAFTLTDQEGNTRNEQDFSGKLMLVFFGFTHCPDICPVTVSTFSSLMELLGDKADQVAPLFITVDPQRDTPDVMKDYLSNFDSRIVGLTGTEEQVKSVADAYKAYYSKAKQPATSEAADTSQSEATPMEDNYFVDHSGFIYLMDRQGKYVQHFRYDVSEQELADALKPYLE